jgi:hypothetical protein
MLHYCPLMRLCIPSGLFPLGFPTENLPPLLTSSKCTTWPSYLLVLITHRRPNIWWWAQILKLAMMQSSPSSCYFLVLRSKHSGQHPFLRHLQSMFFHHLRDQVSHPHKRYDYSFVYFYFTFCNCQKMNFNTLLLATVYLHLPSISHDRQKNWEPHLLTDLSVSTALYTSR